MVLAWLKCVPGCLRLVGLTTAVGRPLDEFQFPSRRAFHDLVKTLVLASNHQPRGCFLAHSSA